MTTARNRVLLAVVALAATLVLVLGLGVAPSQAAQSGSINTYANSQRQAAGAPELTPNGALTALATDAAVRSASKGTLQAPGSIPSGYTSTQTVLKSLTTTDPAATYQRALTSHGGVMNGRRWTDIGTGFASAGGTSFVVLIYATYPPQQSSTVADEPPVKQAPAPAPVKQAPAPAPVPVKQSPAPAPAPTPVHAKETPKVVAHSKPAPVPSHATKKPASTPAPRLTPKPSKSPSPTAAKPSHPSATPPPVVNTRTVVKEVVKPAMNDAQRRTVGSSLLGTGALSLVAGLLSARRWSSLRKR